MQYCFGLYIEISSAIAFWCDVYVCICIYTYIYMCVCVYVYVYIFLSHVQYWLVIISAGHIPPICCCKYKSNVFIYFALYF